MSQRFTDLLNKIRSRPIPVFFVLSFLLWLFMFRGFVFGELALVKDAISYDRQIGVYTESIADGMYPLWDPSWRNGVPTEFFLRRIGNFNPFFFILIVINMLGLSYRTAYGIFLAGYYFLGLLGFYLLARQILQEKRAAFLAFLLLMFSSLSTMLFFSYIQLIFTPYFWFFYFFIAFLRERKQYQVLGMTFTLMLILTTYIPFYFIIIFLIFTLCGIPLYFREIPRLSGSLLRFIRAKKVLVGLCVLAVGLSVLPGYSMYKSGAKTEMAMPARHQDSDETNIYSVSERNIRGGDIASQIYFDRMLFNLKKIQLGLVYVPVFAFLIFLLGLTTRLNRKITLLSLLGGVAFLIGLTNTTGLYQFLYSQIFFFKYIRQSYYFFWICVLPVFVLLLAAQAKQLMAFQARTRSQHLGSLVFVSVVHGGFLCYLLAHGSGIISTYIVLLLSYAFCIWYLNRSEEEKGKAQRIPYFYIVLLCLVVIQPLEVYHYLGKNARKGSLVRQQRKYDLTFEYVRPTNHREKDSELSVRPTDLYYATRWYYLLFRTMDYQMFQEYIAKKFIAYDRIHSYENDSSVITALEEALAENKNIVFVKTPKAAGTRALNADGPDQATLITEPSERFDVLGYNANTITFRTHFDQPKFLVYNDSYHPDWRAWINKKPTKIYRANVAFKGLWLPAGENSVYLRFGSRRDEIKGFLFIGLFTFVLIMLIVSWYQEKRLPLEKR